MNLNKLRTMQGKGTDALKKRLEKDGQSGGFKKDERIWKQSPNSKNICECRIRLLPIPAVDFKGVEEGKWEEDDLTPAAKIQSVFFRSSSNQVYAENSLQTFGEDDPVRDMDGPNWAIANENDDEVLKKILRRRLPQHKFYANALIINDSTNPENNGQVRLFEFGKAIYKIIEEAKEPEFADQEPIDAFCPFTGADLILNIKYENRKFNGNDCKVPKDFANVKFDTPKPLCDGDEEAIKELWEKSYSIMEFYDRKNFKTYDELKKRLMKVMDLDEDLKPKGLASKSTGSSLENDVKERPAQVSKPNDNEAVNETPVEHTEDNLDDRLEKLLG